MKSGLIVVRKVLVGLGGGLIILIGAVLIPTPAPEGWLIVFAGIALLSTEFSFAKRLLKKSERLRLRMDRWLKTLPGPLRVGLNVFVILVLFVAVLLSIWLVVQGAKK
jgi:uncharacterized protein (TIGR02611 family)